MGAAASVIVPVYEQWDLVPGLLGCLGRQTLPPRDFEVILVDNASPHFAPPALLPANVRIEHCATKGSYAARNAGAALATGEWLAFTDADCLPDPGWLAALLLAARAQPGRLLAGAVRMRASDSPTAYEAYDLVKGIPQHRYVARGYAATANLMVPTSIFRRLNGFDPGRLSGGDAEFCRRAGANGIAIGYVPGAAVAHPARASWLELKTKARRVKGGQIGSGPLGRRLFWTARTIAPPLIAWWRFARAPQPLRHRLTAMAVQIRLWGVEIAEALKLLAGAERERR